MNADRIKLGELIKDDQQQRDAVHIAIIPVVAEEDLGPGDSVAMTGGGAVGIDLEDPKQMSIGVVDPFLKVGPRKGDRFWLFLYPGTITSLRHEWTHPAFPLNTAEMLKRKEAEEWLRDKALEFRIDYAEMIHGAASGDGVCFGTDEGQSFMWDAYNKREFFRNLELVTGRRFSDEHIENTYFSCAC